MRKAESIAGSLGAGAGDVPNSVVGEGIFDVFGADAAVSGGDVFRIGSALPDSAAAGVPNAENSESAGSEGDCAATAPVGFSDCLRMATESDIVVPKSGLIATESGADISDSDRL